MRTSFMHATLLEEPVTLPLSASFLPDKSMAFVVRARKCHAVDHTTGSRSFDVVVCSIASKALMSHHHVQLMQPQDLLQHTMMTTNERDDAYPSRAFISRHKVHSKHKPDYCQLLLMPSPAPCLQVSGRPRGRSRLGKGG